MASGCQEVSLSVVYVNIRKKYTRLLQHFQQLKYTAFFFLLFFEKFCLFFASRWIIVTHLFSIQFDCFSMLAMYSVFLLFFFLFRSLKSKIGTLLFCFSNYRRFFLNKKKRKSLTFPAPRMIMIRKRRYFVTNTFSNIIPLKCAFLLSDVCYICTSWNPLWMWEMKNSRILESNFKQKYVIKSKRKKQHRSESVYY